MSKASARGRQGLPSINKIVAAQRDLLDELWIDQEIAGESCWACKLDRITPDRAHIVADCAGGTNHPSNFLLLCPTCHAEQPDGHPLSVQKLWLVTRPSHEERTDARMAPVLKALRAYAYMRKQGAALDEFSEWVSESGQRRIMEAMMRCGAKSAAPSPRTARANMDWGLIAAFDEWIAKRNSAESAPAVSEAKP